MEGQKEFLKFSILIVDDERSNLHTLFHALRTEYDVSVANSGEMALEKIQQKKPDLILLDIMMPDMDGYEVLTRLKKNNDTCGIPVIFITGMSNPEDETKGLFFGAVDYISKPFNVTVVHARVKTQLQIARQISMIERMGMMDALTEIPNRRRFDQQLDIEWAQAIREQMPISLLMIDIDDFKAYNDTHGHPAGDALLQFLSREVSACIKRPHDLFARIGGEEFVVLLPETDMKGAVFVGEMIRAAIEKLNMPSGLDIRKPVTVSIGVESVVPGREDSSADFIANSDKRLYIAKKTGKNKLICHDEDLLSGFANGTSDQKKRIQSIIPIKILRNLLDALDTYMFVSDVETDTILFINDKIKERFQLGENVVGQPCHKIMEPYMGAQCMTCTKHKLLEHPDENLKLESQVSISGRHYKQFDQLIEWLDGQKVHLRYFIDITESRTTESTLERMAAVVKSSPHFFANMNRSGECDFINPAVSEISGYSHDEIMSGGIELLFDEQTNHHIKNEIIPEIMEKGRLSFELPLIRRDGEVRILLFSAFVLASEENDWGVIATDVTEQKWLEREILEVKENLQTIQDLKEK